MPRPDFGYLRSDGCAVTYAGFCIFILNQSLFYYDDQKFKYTQPVIFHTVTKAFDFPQSIYILCYFFVHVLICFTTHTYVYVRTHTTTRMYRYVVSVFAYVCVCARFPLSGRPSAALFVYGMACDNLSQSSKRGWSHV